MSVVRHLAIVPLVAAIALAGCKPRHGSQVAESERAAESERLGAQMQQIQDENQQLKTQLAQAREELDKGQGGTVGGQAAGLGVDGLGEGFTATAGGGVALGEDFAFERGSASLSSEGRKAVEKLALRLNDGDLANHTIIVEGHTDDQPVSRPRTVELFTDNWGLSAARAASVVRALQKAGVKAERLIVQARGQYKPAVGGKDKSANRRVEIYLGK
jgi:flagellar motor protein MotB